MTPANAFAAGTTTLAALPLLLLASSAAFTPTSQKLPYGRSYHGCAASHTTFPFKAIGYSTPHTGAHTLVGLARRSPSSNAVGRIMSTADVDAGETTTAEGGEELWWKAVVFEDAALPESVLKDFPILSTMVGAEGSEESEKKPLVYLDSAATSQKPTFVTDMLTDYYLKANSNVHRGAHALSREATGQYEAARDAIARFVNAFSRNEIVFTSGATEAINLVAYCYGRKNLKEGDVIITTELEHHSNLVPWQMIAEETGATLKEVPVSDEMGTPNWDAFRDMLDSSVKLVSIQHVSNVMGCVNPTADIVDAVRSKAHPDAKIMLDACQSVPHMTVDVQKLDCDFLAASGHKLCGPTGIGFLWGREELLNSMPPFMGGGEMIDEVYNDRSTYAKAPARFEAGTPAIAQAIGMGAAVDYLNGIGMDRIEKYEQELGAYLHRRMEEVPGVTVLGPPSGGEEGRAALVSFVCDKVHPSDLSTFLDMEGVAIRAGHHCCQPLHRALGYSHSARASLYFYNTKEDIDFFVEKLEETLKFFGNLAGGPDGEEGGDNFVPFI